MSKSDVLQFQPFNSFIQVSFWDELTSFKVQTQKTDDSPIRAYGIYNPLSKSSIEFSIKDDLVSRLNDDECITKGHVINVNSLSLFNNYNISQLKDDFGKRLWSSIESDAVSNDPRELFPFCIFCYADIKAFKLHYRCLFPTFKNTPMWKLEESLSATDAISSNELSSLIASFRNDHDASQHSIFILVQLEEGSWSPVPLVKLHSIIDSGNTFYIAAVDSVLHEQYPSWPIRNLLLYLNVVHKLESVSLLLIRDTIRSGSFSRSIILKLRKHSSVPNNISDNVVGWERNEYGKTTPRLVNFAPLIDPNHLASTASMLNLSLMKWRLVPDLNLEKITNLKCLILGSGTLGCHVARNLMAWGVRNITFIDNSRVSYSNPVRQSLFTFEDCKNGGQWKAECAAKRLKEICPDMKSKGYNLTIPMIGHPISASEVKKVKSDYTSFEQLMIDADVIFLLTDTRESRWLPSVIAAELNKTLINAALGFDSWVVMRHGKKFQGKRELGCYFCNDVFAPTNSMLDRSIDQTCTITRPGAAAQAASFAVELLTSLTQHELFDKSCVNHGTNGILGEVPHQLRGFLHDFTILKIEGKAYPHCSACNPRVCAEWSNKKWEFVANAMNDSKYIEDLSGLSEIHEQGELADDIIAWGSDPEDDE
ncbi:ubiquitin-like conjugating enzyme Atg7 [Schizosaccharomyces japonicus yFS275]|uniref:Ubiquitin-like modifier-activating enzyme ATG7 n=1 Tax=Schizosaccharomyces japonicus (strain yFS275 / FY16936) TaxID=402676 RepID=B6JW75_SCHJY|nr:ubiquitin-like conjugating enzyme Atg7 [Schizosaccharomyces japonicus yFS275]EEB05626.1 ubiquitin-like conjugating enzyme Atg7 [Schizosaccharomyces japonicus yFS275]